MDATKPPGRLKVVLLSLPPRTQAVLDFFIANTGRSSFTAAREEQADAAVFDHDHPDSRAHWLQFHQRYGKPGIMLSIHAQALEHTTPVTKPITPAALLTAAANVAAGRLQAAAAAAVVHQPPAVVHLPPAVVHLPPAVVHLPPAVVHLPPAPPPPVVPAPVTAAPAAATANPAVQTTMPLPQAAEQVVSAVASPAPSPLVSSPPIAEPSPEPEATATSAATELALPAAASVAAATDAQPEAEPASATAADAPTDAAFAKAGAPEQASEPVVSQPPAAVAPPTTHDTPATTDLTVSAAVPPAQVSTMAQAMAASAMPAPAASVTTTRPATRPAQAGVISPTRAAPVSAGRPGQAVPPGGLGSRVGGFLRKLFVGEVASPGDYTLADTTSRAVAAPVAPASAARATATATSDTPAAIAAAESAPASAAGHAKPSAAPAVRPAAQAVPVAPAKPVLAAVRPAAPVAAKPAQPPAAKAMTPAGTARPVASPAAAAAPAHAAATASATAPRSAGQAGSHGHPAQPFADEALLCGTREDLPTARWTTDHSLRYEPADHLIGALREAWQVGGKWRVPTHIELPLGRVVVDTAQGRVHCEFDPAKLATLWTTPLAKRPKTRTLNRQEAREFDAVLAQPGTLLRLDQLLWRGGMLTGAGRLPAGVDVTRTIYLKHWPNFTRIERTPHSVRMAALWATRGASIVETAKLAGVPQRQVVAFYNGMAALDLITEDGSHIRRAQRKQQNRGLLTRLLGWLNH